jgi:uncharacterized protein YjbI with pentapeptide repeats
VGLAGVVSLAAGIGSGIWWTRRSARGLGAVALVRRVGPGRFTLTDIFWSFVIAVCPATGVLTAGQAARAPIIRSNGGDRRPLVFRVYPCRVLTNIGILVGARGCTIALTVSCSLHVGGGRGARSLSVSCRSVVSGRTRRSPGGVVARFEDRFPPLPGHPPRLEQPSASLRPRRGAIVRGALGVAAVVLVLVAVLFLPRLLLDWDLAGAPVGDRAKAVNDIRTGLLQAVGGLVVVAGAVLTWRQVQVNRAGQVTDAFATAITHLGDPSLDVRLGGIYALERISRTSKADRQAIEEVLCLFVKNRATTENREIDVNVALLVLGRRRPAGGALALDRVLLHDVRLQFANLAEVDLHFANLDGAHLFGANLTNADLSGVTFRETVLVDATLHQADLRDAVLTGAYASNADLRATDLSKADLRHAHLDHSRLNQADLRGANLTGADLAHADLTGAVVDDATVWPGGFEPHGVARSELPLRPRTFREAVQ